MILHDCVSHGSRPLLLTVAFGAAAAFAAGEDNEGALGGAAVGGATGPACCGSFLLPVAHPVSAKTSKAAAGFMIYILIIFFGFSVRGCLARSHAPTLSGYRFWVLFPALD